MITSVNTNAHPNIHAGLITPIKLPDIGYYTSPFGPGTVVNVYPSNQIAGLVPVFLCTGPDCREGKYGADNISNDMDFMIPVFAQFNPPAIVDSYFNDYTSFLFDFTSYGSSGSSMTFWLDKKVNGVWQQLVDLGAADNTYGIYYPPGSICSNLNWQGFTIQWWKILAYDPGIFRFRVETKNFGITKYNTCFQSPPFCLSIFDCYAADRTTKFETAYSGGKLGSIDKSNCGGKSWDFCCFTPSFVPSVPSAITPITWGDSVRVEGFFGYEDTDYERKSIKYQTGQVNKIRDEAILKFKWKSGSLPFWFHERFKAYGLFADQLLVSDYNLNNSDYNLKKYCVQADGSYNPEYFGRTRYTKVKTDFKAATQYIIRTRCCDTVVPQRT